MIRLKKDNVEKLVGSEEKAKRLEAIGFIRLGGSASRDDTKVDVPPVALEEMTVKELRALARQNGLGGASSLTKAELLELLAKPSGKGGARTWHHRQTSQT